MFKHFKSRKFTMAAVGILTAVTVYFITIAINVVLLVYNINASEFLLGMFNTFFPLIGSVVGVLIGGQSFVDWKHDGGSNVELKKEVIQEISEETINLDFDADIAEKLQMNFSDDESVAPLEYINNQPQE